MKSSFVFKAAFLLMLCCCSIKAQSQDFLTRDYVYKLFGDSITHTSSDVLKLRVIRAALTKKAYQRQADAALKNKPVLPPAKNTTATSNPSVALAKNTARDSIRSVLTITFKGLRGSKAANNSFGSLNTPKLSGVTEKDVAGSLFTELLTDQAGLWRFSFASAITASKNDTSRISQNDSRKDVQSFLAGGGNVVVKAVVPIFMAVSTTNPLLRHSGIFFVPRVGLTVPALGSNAATINGNIDIGLEPEVFIGGNHKSIGFYVRGRSGLVIGTKAFTRQFLEEHRQVFGYNLVTFGLLLEEKMLISVNAPVSGPIGLFGSDDATDRMPTSISVGFLFSQKNVSTAVKDGQ